MNPRIPLAALVLGVALGACSSGPPKRLHPSTASIQQLAIQPDGSWHLQLRVQNFSTFPMRYAGVQARLTVEAQDVGMLDATTDIEILANSGDVVEARLPRGPALAPDHDFAYRLEGTIRTSEPSEAFKFERASRLSPVPGIPNTWR